MLSLQARALLAARSLGAIRMSGVWVDGGHAHFRPYRPDLGDKIDHPADFGFNRLVDFEALPRPWAKRQGADALRSPPLR